MFSYISLDKATRNYLYSFKLPDGSKDLNLAIKLADVKLHGGMLRNVIKRSACQSVFFDYLLDPDLKNKQPVYDAIKDAERTLIRHIDAVVIMLALYELEKLGVTEVRKDYLDNLLASCNFAPNSGSSTAVWSALQHALTDLDKPERVVLQDGNICTSFCECCFIPITQDKDDTSADNVPSVPDPYPFCDLGK